MASGPAAPAPVAAPPPAEQPYSMPQLTPLDAPTARPGEPVTTGLPVGPGAGPEAIAPAPDDTLTDLLAVYRLFPSNDLRELIERAENGI